ncbi:spore coat protein [Bacillus manliponensis]|uniref:Spore coat protein n=1 Tax=Bacillus manliponensis TaxID=574376 RepID=A0A073JYV1_9BACI|nr:CotY/CotZ family spore coat protein [Bacillus manliponensis]KEK20249.1 spore coat protein [Bacillus manliponensis]
MNEHFNDENHPHLNFHCVCSVVRFIHELQESASATCQAGCDVPFLGAHYEANAANTRPFILYTKSGKPFEAYVPSSNMTNCLSPIFRVESIDNDCYAVLRALTVYVDGEPSDANPINTYLSLPHTALHSTSSCVIVDLNSFSGIQCLRDTYVANY